MAPLSDYLPDPLGKGVYRLHAKQLREEAHRKQPHAARHAAANFITRIPLDGRNCVAVYYPAGSELHTWPLVEELQQHGRTVCLPVINGQNKPLTFRRYDGTTAMEAGAYGIMAPAASSPACVPDVVVVPLLGFKRDGARLGMGGGFYDRTLDKLRRERNILAVGYAYADQEMERFPVERHDQPLNWIVTEREAIRIR